MARVWDEEFEELDVGDERLRKRVIRVCERFSEIPQSPISRACADAAEAQGAYRLFSNPTVSERSFLDCHAQKTQERMQGHETVLVVQDTTYLNYTAHPATEGLGAIDEAKGFYARGLIMHSALAMSTEGLPLGFLYQQIRARPDVDLPKGHERDIAPIEEKESYRWIEGIKATRAQADKRRIVTICDREADFYELFAQAKETNTSVVIRSQHNRAVNKASQFTTKYDKLWELVKNKDPLGEITLTVPSRRETKGSFATITRTTKLEVRMCPFQMTPPRRFGKARENLPLWIIQVIEKDKPKDGSDKIEWLLLTSIPVETLEQAVEKVQWYVLRWRIEMFHKVLKSVFQVEECRLGEASKLIRYLTLVSIVAWRLFLITLAGREHEERPATDYLSDLEWKLLYWKVKKTKKLPPTQPTIQEAVMMIARMGGFLGSRKGRPPGSIVLARGWCTLMAMVEGAQWALSLMENEGMG